MPRDPSSQTKAPNASSTTEADRLPRKWYLRAAIFLLFAGWMLWGPFYRQVLHGKSNAFREWRMYGTRGIKSCRVDYFTMQGKNQKPISRMKALRIQYGSNDWNNLRHLNRKSQAVSAGQELCRKLSLDSLHFSMRCGDAQKGWKTVVKRSKNLCRSVRNDA